MTNNTAKVLKLGPTVLNMMVATYKARNKAKDTLNGLMVAATKEIFWTTIFMVKVSISGQTKGITMETGNSIKCTGMVFSLGTMVDVMKASTSTTKNKVREFSTGQMAESIKVAGKMVSSTALEST